VEERQHHQDDVVVADAEQPTGGVGVHVQLEVGQLRALRRARGAGRVDDDRGVARVRLLHGRRLRLDGAQRLEPMASLSLGNTRRVHHVDRRRAGVGRALHRLVGDPGPGDQRPGLGVAEAEGDLGRLQQNVQRHGNAARLEHAEVGDEELGNVGQLQPDGLPRAHAGRPQPDRAGPSCSVTTTHPAPHEPSKPSHALPATPPSSARTRRRADSAQDASLEEALPEDDCGRRGTRRDRKGAALAEPCSPRPGTRGMTCGPMCIRVQWRVQLARNPDNQAKSGRNHDPRVGGSSPSSGMTKVHRDPGCGIRAGHGSNGGTLHRDAKRVGRLVARREARGLVRPGCGVQRWPEAATRTSAVSQPCWRRATALRPLRRGVSDDSQLRPDGDRPSYYAAVPSP
jgi:hypothetical protein